MEKSNPPPPLLPNHSTPLHPGRRRRLLRRWSGRALLWSRRGRGGRGRGGEISARNAGFAGCDAPRNVFLLVDDWHLMLGNTAGLDQKDSTIVEVVTVAHARLVLAGFRSSRAVFLLSLSGRDALSMASMDQMDSYAVQGHLHPCRCVETFLMIHTVLRIIAIPQSFLDKVVNAPVMQVCRPSKSLSWRLGSFSWSSRP